MTDRILLLVTMAALAASGLLVRAGKIDDKQDLESVARLWGDVFWDASRATGKVAHVSIAQEVALGDQLAGSAAGLWTSDYETRGRVLIMVGRLSPHVRRRMPYTAHVIASQEVNAFSLPGGHVYVTSGLLGFTRNDDELAGVIGHEMAHIDLEHCLDQHRYEAALSGHGVPAAGVLLDMVRQAAAITYSQQQEFDADARGAYLAALAGYDPKAMVGVFQRLDAETRNSPVQGLLRPYFASHPSSAERADRLAKVTAQPVDR
ncbi:M48 family metallopeptidase [uncultured Paludibaculum sp.]|uniref:M48 family metallopeptidase n=1 Tax=uncultured Paludibaculum sp. TaxID=1765020 RepID=UPI002AAADEE4|nr:M48 family metallopeptidase [uncultured Paludibaculum sp.]